MFAHEPTRYTCHHQSSVRLSSISSLHPFPFPSLSPWSSSNKLTLETVYRPPKLQAADDTALYNEIHCLIPGKNAIIIGDLNCANVNWGLLTGDQEGSILIEMIEYSFLTQVITPLTRENSILDLVLVSDPDLIRD